VSAIHDRGVTITLDGSQRKIQLARENLDSLRLAYAQHVYRQQGATVERSVVLTGGWQTSKETAYVEATRARHGTDWFIARDDLGTDWFIARDDLGTEGQDPQRIARLAQRMRSSRARTPSLAYREMSDPRRDLGFELGLSRPLRLARSLVQPTQSVDRTSDRGVNRGR
jgi:hypothetical protein